ncbi:ECF transporter S component [Solibacillus sp. FSL H8-0538]|uniref:ECF transporter S component n=1 Tax=Solibacillus sp. FSL H8-0538 TaxID=2921400 RepID=UPI0030FBC8C7
MDKVKLRLMVLTALVAAICVIGSFIKVPGFITTAALDSAPAFLSVLFLPPLYSGFAGAIGHLATGLSAGMPLGVFHALIAAEMFIIVYVFNVLHRKNFKLLKWIFLIIANGIISPFPFYFLVSPEFYIGSVPSLLVATVINVVLVMVVMPILKPIVQKQGLQS